MKRFVVLAATLAVLVPGLTAVAQEGMEMPKPTAEHERLAKDVGEWEATTKMWMDPTQPPMESKATESVSMLGGFWQVAKFKSEFMGQPFTGLGLVGWDAEKKHYVNVWVDSSAPTLSRGHSTYDEATGSVMGTMTGLGPDGKLQKMRQRITWPDADTRIFTMSTVGPDGQETTTMEITYKRKK